jgi:hypothetical protein
MVMAFLMVYLVIMLIREDWELKYVLLLAVYGVDSVLTIVHRLFLKENIFKAHRKHLYQYLSNELGVPQLFVAGIYAILQLLINFWVVNTAIGLTGEVILLVSLGALYILLKYMIISGRLRPLMTFKGPAN